MQETHEHDTLQSNCRFSFSFSLSFYSQAVDKDFIQNASKFCHRVLNAALIKFSCLKALIVSLTILMIR